MIMRGRSKNQKAINVVTNNNIEPNFLFFLIIETKLFFYQCRFF